ncbi:MAG: 6-carboxytetrahydropterin synthase [Fimbriimonadaceae bacterium]|nr:6-carboxytetrahydropterin synthase [Fimbriimonadaceae bacterium]
MSGPIYRVCRRFVVESGHMLSRHPEACRFPHGHTRTIEVVVASDELDDLGMVVDFKALKLALEGHLDRYDHAIAVNKTDPFLKSLRSAFPESAFVVFEGEPTTEAIAKEIFDHASRVLADGFEAASGSGTPYRIPPGRCRLERVRVWETPSSWAEVAR